MRASSVVFLVGCAGRVPVESVAVALDVSAAVVDVAAVGDGPACVVRGVVPPVLRSVAATVRRDDVRFFADWCDCSVGARLPAVELSSAMTLVDGWLAALPQSCVLDSVRDTLPGFVEDVSRGGCRVRVPRVEVAAVCNGR